MGKIPWFGVQQKQQYLVQSEYGTHPINYSVGTEGNFLWSKAADM
jgi:hypothetical protein